VSEPTDHPRPRKRKGPLRVVWTEQDSFGWVFLLMIINVVLLITMPYTSWARALQVPFVAATLVAALRTSVAPPRLLRVATIAALVAIAASVALAAFGSDRGAALIYLIMAALLLVTAPVMLWRLLTRGRVDGQVLMGALGVYLMIGLFFAFIFLGIAVLNDGVFFTKATTENPADFVYFSYVTMLTIGYGDLTPATDMGRMLAVMDGLLGQVFLVTMVARLVSLFSIPRKPSGDR
jgi:hypothetical protein